MNKALIYFVFFAFPVFLFCFVLFFFFGGGGGSGAKEKGGVDLIRLPLFFPQSYLLHYSICSSLSTNPVFLQLSVFFPSQDAP